jgi:hypothetical protein
VHARADQGLRLRLAVPVALALGLALAACGDGDEGAAAVASVDCGCDAGDAQVAAVDVAVVPTPTCDLPWFAVQGSANALLPPPIELTVTALTAGAAVQAACTWEIGPANVCVPGNGPGRVRKVGDGRCSVVCRMSNGTCGAGSFEGRRQPVVYVVGGESPLFPPPKEAAAAAVRVQRLRTLDAEWDGEVAWLPEFRVHPALGVHGGQLYVLGGETGGDYAGAEFWDVFFPTCSEAIVTPTQLKQEIGCRAVRRLDLLTGTWDTPFQWPHPRSDAGFKRLGSQVFLIGGVRAKTITQPPLPELAHIVDLATGTALPTAASATQALVNANLQVKWPRWEPVNVGGEWLLFAGGKTWSLGIGFQTLAEKDTGWPCAENAPRAVFQLGGDVFVLPSPKAKGETCQCPEVKVLPDGTSTQWCKPWRLHAGTWSQEAEMPYVTVVEADDGVYALAGDATWRLQKPAGAWQPVAPPMPLERFGFAAVAVTQ